MQSHGNDEEAAKNFASLKRILKLTFKRPGWKWGSVQRQKMRSQSHVQEQFLQIWKFGSVTSKNAAYSENRLEQLKNWSRENKE